jgi:tetratricopeptide (TPR) repeat protein
VTVAKKRLLQSGRRPALKGAGGIFSAGVRRENLIVCSLLVLLVAVVFAQTVRFGFINYDDSDNVYENSVVEKGLTPHSVGWAFTHVQVANWIPLTTLSHMLDCQLFGMNAGGHHLVNVLFHAASAVMLFLVLRRMTGGLWPSAFVAAVFAVHPLRAESVAWVSERKDVLSGLFFMLTLLAYARYAQGMMRGDGRESKTGTGSPIPSYCLALAFFVCGLLSKPMIATLPFVLLLLDCWPLKRFSISDFQFPIFFRLAFEKTPFFLLSAASCAAVAFVPGLAVVPPPGLVTTSAGHFPLDERIGNALVSCAIYLRQMIFPAGLAMPYPNAPNGVPAWEICLAFIVLAAISAGVIAWRKERPFLLVGWLWFLGMLIPVIGIVEISDDVSHADRYTYLPGIGLTVAATWAMAEWSARWKQRRLILGALMVITIGTLTACACNQTSYWKNSETLWERALSCNASNTIARNNLGRAFAEEGKSEEAIAQYRRILEIEPGYAEARNNLGIALFKNGDLDGAIGEYRKTLETEPDYLAARINLGNALGAKGLSDEAIAQYQKAIEISPDDAEARYNLGVEYFQNGELDKAIEQYRKVLETNPDADQARNNLAIALYKKGQVGEAIQQYQKALETNPRYADAHNNLGAALMQAGRVAEAIDQYRKALEAQPQNVDALNALAWVLATCPQASLRDGAGAVQLAQKAVQLAGGENPPTLRTLAAAYAEAGQYAQAVQTARRAMQLANAQGSAPLAGTLEQELELYQIDTPVREGRP